KHTAPLLLSQSLAPPPHATLFPYTTLFRSAGTTRQAVSRRVGTVGADGPSACHPPGGGAASGHERFNRAGAHPANCQPSAGVAGCFSSCDNGGIWRRKLSRVYPVCLSSRYRSERKRRSRTRKTRATAQPRRFSVRRLCCAHSWCPDRIRPTGVPAIETARVRCRTACHLSDASDGVGWIGCIQSGPCARTERPVCSSRPSSRSQLAHFHH